MFLDHLAAKALAIAMTFFVMLMIFAACGEKTVIYCPEPTPTPKNSCVCTEGSPIDRLYGPDSTSK